MPERNVLIVGAGPTGLALALELARRGVPFRIVERHDGPGQASRAMAVHARTLEFYRQLGFADEVVARGFKMERAHLREGDHEVASFAFGDLGEGLSPYPFVLSFPQDEHERLLIAKLEEAGTAVEWGTELVGLENGEERVRATLRRGGAEESCEVAYLCGCDGAHSAVREGLGLGFPGGTYEQMFYVADVEASGAPAGGDINAYLGADQLCLVFPIRTSGMQRLIGILPEELKGREGLVFDDVRPYAERLTGLTVRTVNWFSSYHVHHRVADRFRVGRAFIAGDAGHIHSPAGGQGMNTGIGDAVNLAWKLDAVLSGRATPAILDTYEPERIAFARLLVSTTDRAFTSIVGRDTRGHIVRTLLIPNLGPFLLGFSAVRRAAFRLVSQIRINYRESPLSVGSAGDVEGGDRLPWVEEAHNFEPLRSLDWQAHVYGEAGERLRAFAASRSLAVHAFAWGEGARAAGLERDALYLVRPDGHVAFASGEQDVAGLERFLDRFRIVTK